MSDPTALLDRLDHELDHDLRHAGPPAPTGEHLHSGHRALRRRRGATALAGAGLVGVLGLGAALWPVGGTTPPVASPGASTTEWFGSYGEAATVHPETGELLVRPGWEITREVADPIGQLPVGGSPVTRSWGLEASDGTSTQYLLLWWRDRASGVADETHDEGPRTPTLATWLDVEVAVETRTTTAALVSAAPDGTLLPADGVVVVDQRPAPELGADVVVARLRHEDDPVWAWVEISGGGEALAHPVPYPFAGDPVTLDGFVDHLQRKQQ
jgi:hypothetical protein